MQGYLRARAIRVSSASEGPSSDVSDVVKAYLFMFMRPNSGCEAIVRNESMRNPLRQLGVGAQREPDVQERHKYPQIRKASGYAVLNA